jgi:photosystem II stability/assembly factor-like uncharacterized protein
MTKILMRAAILIPVILFLFRGPVHGQLRQVYLDSDSANQINRISFFSPAEGYVAFTKWIGHTTDSGRTFTKVLITNTNVNYNGYSVNITFGFEIAGVKAFNANTLIAYGDYGLVPAILYSSNGGGNWTLVFLSQYSPGDFYGGITDMLFPMNDNIGFAIDADRILKTTNGGQNWSVIETSPNAFFNHLEGVDDNTVFAMSTGSQAGLVLRTTNGGAGWQSIAFPPVQGGVMTYSYFLNSTIGWMSLYDPNYNFYFYKTVNGGNSWTLQNNLVATPFSCTKMHFTDENTGYALVSPFEVYKTSNSGVLWEPLPRDNHFTYLGYTLIDMQFLSSTQWWAGGGHGYLELTTDGGGTPVPTPYFSFDTTHENVTGTVNLVNFSNPAYACKWFVNHALVSTSYNTSYSHQLSSFADTVTLVVTSGGISDSLTKYQYFAVPNLPVIGNFAPSAGGTGTLVTINGSGFSNVTAVSFGATAASSFTVLSDNVITAIVASGASGPVSVRDIHGSYALAGFTYLPAPSGPPPVISSILPAAAPVGSTITINGSRFGPVPAANMVFFGTIRATVQSASPTSIVCQVPAGASLAPVSVTNTANGLMATSPRPFNISFADSSNFTPGSFSEVFTLKYNEYTYPLTIQGKDLDGDGKPDLIAYTRFFADTISVYRNTSQPGSISFAPRVNAAVLPNGLSAGVFQVADIDGDGLPDIVANGASRIFRNTSSPGRISFASGVNVPGGGGSGLVVADFDNDGRNDIVSTNYTDGSLSLARNTGAPGVLAFGPVQYMRTGGNPNSITAGDIDGDGKSDLILYNTGNLSVLRNTSTMGNISFAAGINMAVPGHSAQGQNIVLADYDGDGVLDIVFVEDNNVCIFRNLSTPGNISFGPLINIPINIVGQGASLSNYGGGTTPDILVGDWIYSYFLLFRNNSKAGTISIDSAIQLSGAYSYSTDGADFDGDGKPDIATAYTNYNSISVLRNGVGTPQKFAVCAANPASSTITSDVSGSSYQWQRNSGGGFVNIADNDTVSGSSTSALSFIHTPSYWNGYKYRCLVGGMYSSVFGLEVDSLSSPGVMINTGDSVTCYGATASFTASDRMGGTAYSFNWMVNGQNTGSSGSQFTSRTLEDKNLVRVVLYYNNACGYHGDTSRAITMKVTELPDSVTISTPSLTPCSGVPVVFTANAVNPGSNPSYTWTVNRVVQPETGPVFTTSTLSPVAADDENLVQVTLNGSAACAFPAKPVSNTLIVRVTQTLTPDLSMFVPTRTICQGASLTFSATPGNLGNNPSFHWTINGVGVGPNYSVFTTDSLNDQDTVRCLAIGQQACITSDSASSQPIIITVTASTTPSVTVSSSDTVICPGSTVLFTAHPLNGGSSPTFQWQKNGAAIGGNGPSYSASGLADRDAISVVLTSNAACVSPVTATSSPIILTVVNPTIVIAGNTTVPPGNTVTFTATATGAGIGPGYQWQDSTATHGWQNISQGTSPTINYTPAASGDQLRCTLTGRTGCGATSNALSFTVSKSATDVRYYPNPVSSTLYIDNTDRTDAIASVSVMDASGKIYMTLDNLTAQTLIKVDVAGLPKGVYFVSVIRASGKRSHFSFVKF